MLIKATRLHPGPPQSRTVDWVVIAAVVGVLVLEVSVDMAVAEAVSEGKVVAVEVVGRVVIESVVGMDVAEVVSEGKVEVVGRAVIVSVPGMGVAEVVVDGMVAGEAGVMVEDVVAITESTA